MTSEQNQDELFALIHSLSKTERRYFKLYYGHTEGPEHERYVRVFDAVAKMTTFSKAVLQKLVPGELCGKYYSKTKAYLIETILDALSAYAKGGGEFQQRLVSELSGIRVLLRKGLSQHAARQLAKVKKKCIESENPVLLLDILNLEMQLQAGDLEKTRLLIGEYEGCLHLMRVDAEVYSLHYDVIELERACSVRPSKEQLALIDTFLERIDSVRYDQLFLDTRRRLVSTQAICFHIQGHPQQAYVVLRDYILQYSALPILYRSLRVVPFMRLLQNALSFAFHTNDLQWYSTCTSELQAAMEASTASESQRFELHLIKTFHLIALSGDYRHLEESVQYVEQNHNMISEISPVRRIDLMFNIALGYFKLGKTRESLQWLDRLFKDEDIKHFIATLRHAYLLEILIHWKLQHSSLVMSRIRSFQRSLAQTSALNPFERVLLRFLNAVATKEKYGHFQRELERFRSDLSSLNARDYSGIVRHYEDLIRFVQ